MPRDEDHPFVFDSVSNDDDLLFGCGYHGLGSGLNGIHAGEEGTTDRVARLRREYEARKVTSLEIASWMIGSFLARRLCFRLRRVGD